MKLVRHAAAALMAAALILPTSAVAHADESTKTTLAEDLVTAEKQLAEMEKEAKTKECPGEDYPFVISEYDDNLKPVWTVNLHQLTREQAIAQLTEKTMPIGTPKKLEERYGVRPTDAQLKRVRAYVEKMIALEVNFADRCGALKPSPTPPKQQPAPKPGTDTNNQGGTNNTKPPAGLGKSEGSGGSSFSS